MLQVTGDGVPDLLVASLGKHNTGRVVAIAADATITTGGLEINVDATDGDNGWFRALDISGDDGGNGEIYFGSAMAVVGDILVVDAP